MGAFDRLEVTESERNGMIWRTGKDGDFESLEETVKNALPGDLILLDEGEYREKIVIDRPLTIRGMGRCVIGGAGMEMQILSDRVTLENVILDGHHKAWENADTAVNTRVMMDGQETRLSDKGERRTAVYLSGDSTMCEYPAARAPRTGWGQALREMMTDCNVINQAVSGRSSKSYVTEGYFARLQAAVRPGDVMIVQFGHNDEKDDPTRHTDPETTYTENLRAYITLARERGAGVILMTSMARRTFRDGQIAFTHGAYPDAVKRLGLREQVPVIDMEKMTMDVLREMGDEASKNLYMWIEAGHPNYPDGQKDNSHLCRAGAELFAGMMLKEIRKAL